MRILFVCSGNTCRSPMAEAYFNNMAEKSGKKKFRAKSAGIYAAENMDVSKNSARAMNELYGLDISGHKSSPLVEKDMEESDLVLTMSKSQKKFLHETFTKHRDKVFTLSEFARINGKPGEMDADPDIKDPFMQDLKTYMKTAEQIAFYIDKIFPLQEEY